MSEETASDARSEPDARTRVEPSGAAVEQPALAAAPALSGERLGRFLVLAKLGEGGMAVVHAAYDTELDRRVAIKVMRGDTYGENGSLGQARLLREAQAMAQLSHPNIVQVYEVGKISEGVFIAMEFVQGRNLREWLTARKRHWRVVLQLFLQAGEGLAAAHAAGIVHRDFKPDNVLVGDDGRVRVLDFGLARPGGTGEGVRDPELRILDSERRGSDVALTQAGSLLGTPAYMAPEQQLAQAADARSDQFSFCVALHEGLFGVRPFAGGDAAELRKNIIYGRMSPPPRDTDVPEWLRAVVLRGMATQPDRRYPAMMALMKALRDDPSQRRRRIAAIVGSTLGVGALVGGLIVTRPVAPDCSHVADDLAGVWDDARRDEVRAAFSATGVPYAEETFARVERDLHRFAGAWTRQTRAHCEAELRQSGRVVGDGDGELGELCLERARVELRALVDVLARADATTVEHARAAVERLREPALCSDPAALAAERALAPLPAERSIAADVWRLRERLAEVRFLELAGRYDEGLQRLTELIGQARELAYPPALAEALLQRAVLLGRQADYADADTALLVALAEAERAGYHALRAEAMVHRLELVGFWQARPEVVDGWIKPTLALVEHVAPGSALAGRALANVGLVRFRQGDFTAAIAAQEQALALLGRVAKEADPDFVRALLDLGRSYHRAGKSNESKQVLERARSLAVRELGPSHPVLIGIYLNLANVSAADSETLYRRSLELSESTFGPNHPSGASALANLGNIYANGGQLELGLGMYTRAVDIYRRSIGEHPTTAFNLVNVASAAQGLGRTEEALAAARESLAIFEKAYPGADHPDMLLTLVLLGGLSREVGRAEESRALLERALALAESAQQPWVRPEAVLVELGETLLVQKEPREVVRRIGPRVEKMAREDRRLVAQLEFLLAQGLWLAAPGERARAIGLAEGALTVMSVPDTRADHPTRIAQAAALARLRAWLAERARRR